MSIFANFKGFEKKSLTISMQLNGIIPPMFPHHREIQFP